MKWFFYSLFLITGLMIGLASCSKSDKNNPEQKREEGDSLRDRSFIPPEGPVWHAAIQPDSQIIVAGNLYNTGLRGNVIVARLSKDGKFDPTFNAHKDNWNYSEVNTLSLLTGGKVLIGGRLEVNGKQVPFLCFNADGSLDQSYVVPTGINIPTAAATAPDGKIFMVGAYRESSTSTRQFVIRLTADGKQDWQMETSNFLLSSLSNVVPLADGKVLVMGNFGTTGPPNKRMIFRLNADLTVDQTFNFDNSFYYSTDPVLSTNPEGIRSAAVQKDGKIIVMGNFIGYYENNGSLTKHDADGVLRLNTNGTIDVSFQTVVNKPRGFGKKVIILDDDRILVTRYFVPDVDSDPTIMYTQTGARVPNSSFTNPHSTIYGITKWKERNNYLLWGSFTTNQMIWRVKF